VVVQDLRAPMAQGAELEGAIGAEVAAEDFSGDLTGQGTIAEAQSWRVNAKGQVELVAYLPQEHQWHSGRNCGD
jgi:hypothetical protein